MHCFTSSPLCEYCLMSLAYTPLCPLPTHPCVPRLHTLVTPCTIPVFLFFFVGSLVTAVQRFLRWDHLQSTSANVLFLGLKARPLLHPTFLFCRTWCLRYPVMSCCFFLLGFSLSCLSSLLCLSSPFYCSVIFFL